MRAVKLFVLVNLPLTLLMVIIPLNEYALVGEGPFCDLDAGTLSGPWLVFSIVPLLASFFLFVKSLTHKFSPGMAFFALIALIEILGYGIKSTEHYHFAKTQKNCDS